MFYIFLLFLSSGFSVEISSATNNDITKDIIFQLFTQQNQDIPKYLTVNDTLDDTIKKNDPWKFFIHGWTTSPETSPWFAESKQQYFKKESSCNIIYVDWSKPANQSYIQSVVNSKGSGKYLAEFINNLKNNDVPLEKIHLLGHSLGSHMAAYAGKHIIETNINKKIGRLTALDPAGPLFDFPVFSIGLSNTDADFVDVIHTDAGQYGMKSTVGHVDYFPNGGKRIQPGCGLNITDPVIENCSHARSTKFFAESITSNQFIARYCSSYDEYISGKCNGNAKATFGQDVDQNIRGVFYFTTNDKPPYAKGER